MLRRNFIIIKAPNIASVGPCSIIYTFIENKIGFLRKTLLAFLLYSCLRQDCSPLALLSNKVGPIVDKILIIILLSAICDLQILFVALHSSNFL